MEGGIDMARLKGKVLGLLVRGWGQGLSRVLGCGQNGRSSGWQGRQMAGCGAWAGVRGCWRVRRSVLRLGEGVGGAGGGAVGRGCWFRQLCSMQAAQVSSPSPTDSWGGVTWLGEWCACLQGLEMWNSPFSLKKKKLFS